MCHDSSLMNLHINKSSFLSKFGKIIAQCKPCAMVHGTNIGLPLGMIFGLLFSIIFGLSIGMILGLFRQ